MMEIKRKKTFLAFWAHSKLLSALLATISVSWLFGSLLVT